MNEEVTTGTLSQRAEALLFTEGGAMTHRKLLSLLGCKEGELTSALKELSEQLQGRGVSLIQTDNEVSLAVSKSTSGTVQEALERELSRDIGDAGLEILSIVLYAGPSTRAKIDYIRGVNSASTLRTLLARELLEREGNPNDAREYLYKPTVELLAHLGVSNMNELPDYVTIATELKNFEHHGDAERATE